MVGLLAIGYWLFLEAMLSYDEDKRICHRRSE
jgi:hypothetical protein